MKEINFRGKQKKNGQWTYGLLGYCNFNHGVERAIFQNTELGSIIVERTIDDTVGQYTGLKDKNGVEIYEGDIVKTKYGRLCKVVWFSSDSDKCFDLQPINMFYDENKAPDRYDLWKSENIEVIGNIYDNPEFWR